MKDIMMKGKITNFIIDNITAGSQRGYHTKMYFDQNEVVGVFNKLLTLENEELCEKATVKQNRIGRN